MSFLSFSRIIMLLFTAVVSLWDILILLLLFGLIKVLLLAVHLGDIVRHRNIVTIIKTIGIVVRLLVSCGIVNIILRILQDCWIYNLRLSGHSFRVRVFRVGAHVHIVIVVPLLFQRWPSFFTNQRVVVFVLSVLLKESLGGWTLALIMVGADVAADVLALVKVGVVHIFFHSGLAHVRARTHHYSSTAGLVRVV